MYQKFGRFSDFPNTECFIEICVHPFIINTDIQIDNIAILQWSIVWNPMTDHFVDRTIREMSLNIVKGLQLRAERFGKPAIVEWRWICILRNDVIMNGFINLVGGHTSPNHGVSEIQSFSSNKTSLSHGLDFFLRLDLNNSISFVLHFFVGLSRECIIWLLYSFRNK